MRRRANLNVIYTALAMALAAGVGAAQPVEIIVKNDSLSAGDSANVCPCFVANEEAAAWLTSPCDGDIVGFQIYWASLFGGAPASLEEAIVVYNDGVFPEPGSVKDQVAGPQMLDGGLNEFRFRDEAQAVPIRIPVQQGETFVLSLAFFNSNANDLFAPSVIFDSSGCQPGKNSIFADGAGWVSACAAGVSGDWVIRAIIECSEDPCPADLNGDGFIDNGDIQLFLTLFLAGDLGADMNGDGLLDTGDIQVFLGFFLGGCP